MKKAPQFTTAVPAAARAHGQRAAKAAALPPHSRRCLPVLGLPYVPASQTTGEHLHQVFTAERQRLALLASQAKATNHLTHA